MRVKKIARARTSLRFLPHQYVWGNPIDVLLLAVHRSKNRLQCKSTKIPHGYWRQANLFVSITIRTNLPDILLPMRLRNDLSFSKIAIFHFVKKKTVKFPHSLILQNVFSSWIEKTMTKTLNTLPLGKQIYSLRQCIVFVIVFSIQELNASCRMGLCGNFTRNETVYIPVCKYWSERRLQLL